MQFTSIQRILSKFHRDLRGSEFNEGDIIEWTGEALEFLRVHGAQEEAVAFLEVKDFQAELPCGFQSVLQLAKNINWSEESETGVTVDAVVEEALVSCSTCGDGKTLSDNAYYPVPLDNNGIPIIDYDVAYYRPFFNLQWEYSPWTSSAMYTNNFVPIRLSNHTFFNTIVCKELDQTPYNKVADEYTIVGTENLALRFNFREGQVALSYLKSATDPKTGYPLIPDNISYITAITYYIKWKLSEREDFLGRENAGARADKAQKLWIKYARQAKNYKKMPKTIDDYQDLLEQSHASFPNFRKYHSFFGKVSNNNTQHR